MVPYWGIRDIIIVHPNFINMLLSIINREFFVKFPSCEKKKKVILYWNVKLLCRIVMWHIVHISQRITDICNIFSRRKFTTKLDLITYFKRGTVLLSCSLFNILIYFRWGIPNTNLHIWHCKVMYYKEPI